MARISCWSGLEERQQVQQLLYSSEAAEQALGVQRVNAWTSRSRVPLAVEATATFVDLLLSARKPNYDGRSLRLAFSMALVRFVNGVVDSSQRGQFAKSVASLAEQLALPPAFVELRHSATHAELPSLLVLISATQRALQWLQANYWSFQPETSVNGDQLLIQARSALTTFQTLQQRHLRTNPRKLVHGGAMKLLKALTESILSQDVDPVLISALVRPSLLLNSNDNVVDGDRINKVPDDIWRCWWPALQLFNNTWPVIFARHLLRALVAFLDHAEQEDTPAHLAVLWIPSILTMLQASRQHLPIPIIVSSCLQKRSRYHVKLLRLLNQIEPVIPAQLVKILSLAVETKLNKECKAILPADVFQAVSVIETRFNKLKQLTEQAPITSSTRWTVATPWVPRALGLSPISSKTVADLQLPRRQHHVNNLDLEEPEQIEIEKQPSSSHNLLKRHEKSQPFDPKRVRIL